MEEFNRSRFAAVLAANSDLETFPGLASLLGRQTNQAAYTITIQYSKGIILEDAALEISRKELVDIVA